MLKKLFSNTFFRGSLIFTAASFVANILSYVFNLIVARAVPLSDYGEYTSSLSYFFILSVPMTALSMIVVKKIGQVQLHRRLEYARTLEKWLYIQTFRHSLQIVSLAILVGAFLWRFSNLHVFSVIFVLLMASTGILLMFYQSILQASKLFFLLGLFVISSAFIKLIGGGILWVSSPNLLGIYFAVLFSVFITLSSTAILFHLKTKVKSVPNIHPDILSYIFKPEIYIPVVTMIGVTAMINIDVMIVKKFFSPEEAGLYGAVSLLGRIILYIASPVSAVAYTFFTGQESVSQSRQVFFLSSLGLFILGVVSTFIYFFFPAQIVGIIFGMKYQSIQHIIWLSALFGSLYGLVNLYAQYLMAKLHALSMLALIVALLQFVALFFFHTSFQQILTINILCSGLLIFIYIFSILNVRLEKR